MGLFLSLTSVVGKTKAEVASSLSKYATSKGGGLSAEVLSTEDGHCCVIVESNGNTTIFNPYAYEEWDASSQFISRDLNAPVFSFPIHDGDLWMYILFVNGEEADQFNPIPDYWTENMTEEEIASWKGDPELLSTLTNNVKPADIERYLVRWDLDKVDPSKAYPDDEFGQEDWQLVDFMRKLSLPYPLNDDGSPRDQTYMIWTKALPLVAKPTEKIQVVSVEKKTTKPWWKFW